MLASITYIFIPNKFDEINNKLQDIILLIRGSKDDSKIVTIVDIDAKSIKMLGQWPWSRDIISTLLTKLDKNDAKIIALDVMFKEEDSKSPINILKKYNLYNKNMKIPDYDSLLSKTIVSTKAILGYQFKLEQKDYINKKTPSVPAIYIEKNKQESNNTLVQAKGTILNISKFQDISTSRGFLHNLSDSSGITRSVPLVISFEDKPFPSLALEISRIALQENRVIINYDELGVENIMIGDFKIPTDIHGKMILNFRGEAKTFKYLSAIDVIEDRVDISNIENKIILIGTSALGLLDLRSIPFDSAFPSVEIHANAVDNILNEDFLYTPTWASGIDILHIIILATIIIFFFLYSSITVGSIMALCIFVGDLYGIYYILIKYGIILNILFPLLTMVLAIIVSIMIKYIFEARQSAIIKNKFSQKISKNVMNKLLVDHGNNDILTGTKREVTMFFSDIRGFTNISKSIKNPKNILKFLNAYMESMSQIIIDHNGTIDKFIGDSIMACWNAPVDVENHADMAVCAALTQLDKLKEINKTNNIEIKIGIGINTGNAIVGDIGSKNRSDYTVIGDSINLGSKIESLCKFYGSTLNISNFTKAKLTKKYSYRFIDLVTVEGKSETVEIWQVHQLGEATGELQKELSLYHTAIIKYRRKEFKQALKILKIVKNMPNISNTKIYDIYIERCHKMISNSSEYFSKIFEHTEK
jgi:adenylate cyclase